MEVNGVNDHGKLDYRALLRFTAEVFDARKLPTSNPAYQVAPPSSVVDATRWLVDVYPEHPPCGFNAAEVRQRIDAAMAQEMVEYHLMLQRADAALSNWDASKQDHYNAELRAPNVWEVDLPMNIIDEAKSIFEAADLAKAFRHLHEADARHQQVSTPCGQFFVLRSLGGMGGTTSSDITWISVDDRHTFNRFERLFERLELAEMFEPVVDSTDRLCLYSAFYVVRSHCESPFFHFDWPAELGVKALTLMTPLSDFRQQTSFNLLYGQRSPEAPRGSTADETNEDDDNEAGNLTGNLTGDSAPELAAPTSSELGSGRGPRADHAYASSSTEARYNYTKGKGIVFGASFAHSTEPGVAHEQDGVHAYLCFTFGTNRSKHWPLIADSIGGHSRVAGAMDGSLVLTRLGREIEIEIETDGGTVDTGQIRQSCGNLLVCRDAHGFIWRF